MAQVKGPEYKESMTLFFWPSKLGENNRAGDFSFYSNPFVMIVDDSERSVNSFMRMEGDRIQNDARYHPEKGTYTSILIRQTDKR